jgi:hypothetical protein
MERFSVIQKKKLKPIISRKWFTIRIRAFLTKMKRVTAVKNVRNTAV